MDVQLTRDTDHFLCVIYEEFLSRRKKGESKVRAGDFGNPQAWEQQLFPDWDPSDIGSAVGELSRANFAKCYLGHGFLLTDAAIIYMENRFPHGLEQVLDALSKFKSAIPFI